MKPELSAYLDSLRDRPRADPHGDDSVLDRLIAGWPPEALAQAIAPRLDDLGRSDGEILLRLVEGLGRPELNAALADALVTQHDLDPERRAETLAILEGTGCIEARPLLLEWRSELDDLPDEDELFHEWATQIDDDPSSIAAQVDALSRIEPDVREEILDGLKAYAAMPAVSLLLKAMRSSP